MSSNFGQNLSQTTEFAALEHFKNQCEFCDHHSASSFNWIFYILQVRRAAIKSGMSLKYGKMGPQTAELAALGYHKKFS